MKKLITLLTSFTVLSLPTASLISCDSSQTKDKNSAKLLNNTSKKQSKSSDDIDKQNDERKNNLNDNNNTKDNTDNVENNNISINSSDNDSDEFEAFKNPKDNEINNELNNKISINKDNEINNSNKDKISNNEDENFINNQKTNNKNSGDKNSIDSNEKKAKEKIWSEKLNEEDPQYLKLIYFIEMISNSTKQLLVDDTYNRLPKYKQLTHIKFWDFFWNSFKTEILKAKTINKKLYNEIFDDAILQTNNSNSNESTYILKSNNFISFTFGYDKRNFNFYFVSQHPKYGKIDSKTKDKIFNKKYEPVYCTIASEDNVVLF